MGIEPKVVLKQKGEEAYLPMPMRPLLIKLKWQSAINLDLLIFYKTKTGEVGGIYPENYLGGSLGDLSQFPFMQLHNKQEENEKTLFIHKISDMEVIYFCTLSFNDVATGKNTAFNSYHGHLEIFDNKEEFFDVLLNTSEQAAIAIIAKIDNSNFMGAKLINENSVIPLNQFLTDIPGAKEFGKIMLDCLKQLKSNLSETPAKPPKTPVKPLETPVKSGYHFAHQDKLPVNKVSLLQQWFKHRNIQLTLKDEKMDISGFFDEIAVELGDNYTLLADLHGKIKWHQRKGISNLNFDLSQYNQKDTGKIKHFCQNLLKAAFITKYYADKEAKKIRLTLQPLPQVINFFNGDWLEWYVFMKVASFLWERKLDFAYCRSGNLLFSNEDKHEIDLFFLINGSIPLWIECKSGEFRSSLQKYTLLRQRININKTNTLLLALGLSTEESNGLTAMFDVSVVNEQNFLTYVATCLN